jgi:hypothetical protein
MNMSWHLSAFGQIAVLSFSVFENTPEEAEGEFEDEELIPDPESASTTQDDVTLDPRCADEMARHRMGFQPPVTIT